MSDVWFRYTLITALFALLLAIITLIRTIKKAQQNQQYNDFFKDRNLDIDDLSNSNKKMFKKKSIGICSKCGLEKEIFTETGICDSCTYEQNSSNIKLMKNLINLDNIKENKYTLKELNIDKVVKSCVFAIENKGEILNVIQTNNFKKELKKIFSNEIYRSIQDTCHIIILECKLDNSDIDNITKFIENESDNLYFIKQLVQLEYASYNNAKYFKITNGDQKYILETLSNKEEK